MPGFIYDALPGRVIFEVGAADQLAAEIDRLGLERVLFIASARWAEWVESRLARLGNRGAGHFDGVVSQAPGELVDRLANQARDLGVDGVISIGGGSPVGLAKAVALLVGGVQVIALPTTYSGSEMTPMIGITRDGLKRVVRDLKVLPKVVIYDPAMTVSLPAASTATTGMNALAHCVEALYAERPVPMMTTLAEAGIRALARALPVAVRRPADLAARGQALYGAYLAGTVVATTGVGIHHRMCHVLGGTFGVGHGAANSVILPQAVAYNADAARAAIDTVAEAMAVEHAAAGIFDLLVETGAPTSLAELGFAEADLDRAAELAVETTNYNPRPVDVASVRAMLDDAFHGRRPVA